MHLLSLLDLQNLGVLLPPILTSDLLIALTTVEPVMKPPLASSASVIRSGGTTVAVSVIRSQVLRQLVGVAEGLLQTLYHRLLLEKVVDEELLLNPQLLMPHHLQDHKP